MHKKPIFSRQAQFCKFRPYRIEDKNIDFNRPLQKRKRWLLPALPFLCRLTALAQEEKRGITAFRGRKEDTG